MAATDSSVYRKLFASGPWTPTFVACANTDDTACTLSLYWRLGGRATSIVYKFINMNIEAHEPTIILLINSILINRSFIWSLFSFIVRNSAVTNYFDSMHIFRLKNWFIHKEMIIIIIMWHCIISLWLSLVLIQVSACPKGKCFVKFVVNDLFQVGR